MEENQKKNSHLSSGISKPLTRIFALTLVIVGADVVRHRTGNHSQSTEMSTCSSTGRTIHSSPPHLSASAGRVSTRGCRWLRLRLLFRLDLPARRRVHPPLEILYLLRPWQVGVGAYIQTSRERGPFLPLLQAPFFPKTHASAPRRRRPHTGDRRTCLSTRPGAGSGSGSYIAARPSRLEGKFERKEEGTMETQACIRIRARARLRRSCSFIAARAPKPKFMLARLA